MKNLTTVKFVLLAVLGASLFGSCNQIDVLTEDNATNREIFIPNDVDTNIGDLEILDVVLN